MTKEERIRKQLERLEEMRRTEDDLHRQGIAFAAGVDEVGRGPLAGPVVTAAVVLPADFDVPGIDDSKKLSEKRREELYEVIMERALAVGTGMSDHREIDEINILEATKKAMIRAVDKAGEDLKARSGRNDAAIQHVLLDAIQLVIIIKSDHLDLYSEKLLHLILVEKCMRHDIRNARNDRIGIYDYAQCLIVVTRIICERI